MDSTANAAEPSLAEQKAEFDAAGGELPATLTPEQFQQCVEEMDRLTPEEFQDWRRRCDALKRRGDAVKTRSIADWRLCSLGQHGHASHEPSALTAAPVVIAASAGWASRRPRYGAADSELLARKSGGRSSRSSLATVLAAVAI
jgi:hypothetical protein